MATIKAFELAKQLSKRGSCLLVMTAFGVVGCQSESDEAQEEAKVEQPPEEVAEPEVTPEQKATQEVEALAAVIEMPDDYIFVAESEISDENLEEQLAKLEAEIQAEESAAEETPAKDTP